MRATLGALLLLVWSEASYARDTATDIIRRGESKMRGRSTQALMVMRITRSDFTRELKLRSGIL